LWYYVYTVIVTGIDTQQAAGHEGRDDKAKKTRSQVKDGKLKVFVYGICWLFPTPSCDITFTLSLLQGLTLNRLLDMKVEMTKPRRVDHKLKVVS